MSNNAANDGPYLLVRFNSLMSESFPTRLDAQIGDDVDLLLLYICNIRHTH